MPFQLKEILGLDTQYNENKDSMGRGGGGSIDPDFVWGLLSQFESSFVISNWKDGFEVTSFFKISIAGFAIEHGLLWSKSNIVQKAGS